MRLVVVGGGITGLAAAYEAVVRGADVTLLEASERLGGEVWTESVDGVPLEWGPDSFVASKPAASELARELGLELIEPEPVARRAYLVRGGALVPFPPGLVMGIPRGIRSALRATPGTGLRAAVRAAWEPVIPGGVHDEPVSELAARRLGPTWARRLVVPLVEGVYGAPGDRLGARAALPQFAGRGSLVRTAKRQPTLTRAAFLSIRGGMGRVVERLGHELESADVRLRSSAVAIERSGDGFVVRTSDGDVTADRVLVAIPAPLASSLVETIASRAAEALARIRFGSSVVVQLRYRPEAIGRPLDGAGYLVPREEGFLHAACTWSSAKWGHGGDTWLRAIVTTSSAVQLPDEELQRRVTKEVARIVRISDEPSDVRMHRWEVALPVYAPGHLDLVESIERELPDGLAVAGASYRGLGVPDCVAGGRSAAARLLEI